MEEHDLMIQRWLTSGVLAGLLTVGMPHVGHADLFDTARNAVRTDVGRADLSGVSLRGGASLLPGVTPGSTPLLRGNASFGGPCGAFSFATSMTQVFEELPDLLESLAQQIASNLPMLVLSYACPTCADLVKHVQSIANALVNARFAQCQAQQNAAMYGGLRLHGGAISQCLEDEVNAGHDLNQALKTCNGGLSALRTPRGGTAPSVALVQETLGAAGASPEMQTLAKNLLGEITLSANNGQFGTQQDRPQAAMLAQYEQRRQEATAALQQALAELQATGQVSDATLHAVSVPGQPLPRAALEALLRLKADPVRYASMLDKLSTGLAVVRLQWECSEIQEQLAGAIDANAHLTDEQRRLLEARLQALQRNLQQVLAKKTTVEQHLQPALDALLQEYVGVQDTATKAGLTAPTVTTPAMPFRGAAPAGYGR